jgi:N-acetylglucosaminyldiphosphoundecaprenol N-acetyl-beta-D-mannosaminyltransferase
VVVALNVHSAVTACIKDSHKIAVQTADLVVTDGGPIAILASLISFKRQPRVDGPDLMLSVCDLSQDEDLGLFLLGSTKETLERLKFELLSRYPRLKIVGMNSPTFGDLGPEEQLLICKTIRESEAHIVFVGLGCPKQELWMSQTVNQIPAVQVGVGAAFDFHAGTVRRAPLWMRRLSLEWLYRVWREPRRLWRRYLVTNTMFFLLVLAYLPLRVLRSLRKC